MSKEEKKNLEAILDEKIRYFNELHREAKYLKKEINRLMSKLNGR